MGSKKKLRYLWILAPILAVALIVSPVFSLPSMDEQHLAVNHVRSESVTHAEPTEEELAACLSVNSEVRVIFGMDVGDGIEPSGSMLEKRLATDLLINEFCKRPDLIKEIVSTFEPGIRLMAFACDAAEGRLGDGNLRESLADYSLLYCTYANKIITSEADYLLAGIEGFRKIKSQTESSGASAAVNQTNDNKASDSAGEDVEARINELIQTITRCRSLLDTESYYEAAKSLDEADKMFADLVSDELQ